MRLKRSTQSSRIDLGDLEPPPNPWGQLATIGSSYILGDVGKLGPDAVVDFVISHPLIAVKTGRKQHVVVGQFRSWELLQAYATLLPGRFESVPVTLVSGSKETIPNIACENLFLEGLISTLSPEYAVLQLADLWKRIPEPSRQKLLPAIHTQADFADTLAYNSRTAFDPRRRNRLKSAGIVESDSQTSEPLPTDQPKAPDDFPNEIPHGIA